MGFPVARALYAFEGSESGDLSFNADDIIRVIRQDDSGWWHGQTDDGRRGDFPYNYVELIDPNDETKIRQFSRMVMTPQQNQNYGQAPVDTVRSIKVTPTPSSSQFTIEAMLSRKKVTAVKTMSQFRDLDENLRFLFPTFDRPLPPYWADNVFENEAASRKRARVLQIYLQKLVGNKNDVTELSVITWMNPRESFSATAEAKSRVKEAQQASARNGLGRNSYNAAMTNVYPLARAEFDWNATDAVELPLQRGMIVAVRNQNTSSAGWWEGETSDGQRGLFPANYVKMMDQNEARQVVSGNAVRKASARQTTQQNMFAGPSQRNQGFAGGVKGSPSKREKNIEENFAMPSLDAFDELLLEGFTMLSNNQVLVRNPSGHYPGEGDQVSLSYTGYVWDCQKQRLIEFAASDLPDQRSYVGPLEFCVGKGQTIKGLERAVQNLEIGQRSRIVVRPDLGYGDVGNPPSVPPNCHLVYDVKLDSFQASNIPGPPPMMQAGQGNMNQGRGDGRGNFPGGQQAPFSPFPGGAPKTLADAIATRQAQNKSYTYQPGAPIDPRPRRTYAQPDTQQQRPAAGKQNNGKRRQKRSSKKYNLSKMKEIVAQKLYAQYDVDPGFIEDRLTEEGFEEAFHCNRAAFLLMPRWKQNKLKKDAGLY